MNLKLKRYEKDFNPIEEECNCKVCKTFTRAYLHTAVTKEQVAGQLISYHNIAFQMRLMRSMREAITDQSFPDWVKTFFKRQFPEGDYPAWAVDALEVAGIHLRSDDK